MSDVTLAQAPTTNNGTATPATPGSQTLTNHNLALLVVAVSGTSPTLVTPASWTLVIKNEGAGFAFGLFAFPNQPGGATNPSVTLGGTVTGWDACMFEFTQTGINCGIQGSLKSVNTSLTQLPNIFTSQIGQTIPNLLFFYTVGRFTTTLTPQNTGLAGLNSGETWSAVVGSVSAQGMNIDSFWGSNLAKGVGSWPNCQGITGASVNSVQIAAWFNTTATQPGISVGTNIDGNNGIMVGTFYQGMVGG